MHIDVIESQTLKVEYYVYFCSLHVTLLLFT